MCTFTVHKPYFSTLDGHRIVKCCANALVVHLNWPPSIMGYLLVIKTLWWYLLLYYILWSKLFAQDQNVKVIKCFFLVNYLSDNLFDLLIRHEHLPPDMGVWCIEDNWFIGIWKLLALKNYWMAPLISLMFYLSEFFLPFCCHHNLSS